MSAVSLLLLLFLVPLSESQVQIHYHPTKVNRCGPRHKVTDEEGVQHATACRVAPDRAFRLVTLLTLVIPF